MNLLRVTLPRFYLLAELSHYVDSWTIKMDRPLLILLSLISKRSPRVLMADDDADDRELFEAAVAEIAPNIEVATCRNGLELMNTLLDESIPLPDIIFLDLNMPFKNGQECLEEIRRTPRLRSLPVIIYSTSANREYVDQTYSQGADYYLAKPDSYGDLKLITSKLFALDWGTHTRPQKEKFLLTAKQFK